MSEGIRKFLNLMIFLVLPIVILISGAVFNVMNIWFYVLSITWFGLGLMILTSIEDL